MEKLTYTHNADAAAVIAQTYDTPPLAYVRSYGCQQNVNDGEKIRGVLMDIGFGVCDSVEQADLILFNTCAVREHAEQRVFGNVGALKKLKEKNPRLIIGVCGCMAQQKHIVDKLRASYPYVDLVFGVDGIDRLPAMLVLGNEDKGVRPGVLKRCEADLAVPFLRDFDSLNVAQAGAILVSCFARSAAPDSAF